MPFYRSKSFKNTCSPWSVYASKRYPFTPSVNLLAMKVPLVIPAVRKNGGDAKCVLHCRRKACKQGECQQHTAFLVNMFGISL